VGLFACLHSKQQLFSLLVSDVTQILNAIEQGDLKAAEQLLPLVYGELRKLAAQKLAHEEPGQTLQATALVHEAYLRLAGGNGGRPWRDGRHFFAAAAEAMRRILIENVRRKNSIKRGGHRERVPLDQIDAALPQTDDELLALDEALARLAAERPDVAELVKLRFFGGLTTDQAAEALDVSPATAYRHWNYARAWLFRAVADESE
jgi:RNA polymerase sigma factor (TIGR02999 family)